MKWKGSLNVTNNWKPTFLKKDFIYLFLESGREKRGRETSMCSCLGGGPPPHTGDLVHNPGMRPDRESNWRPLGLQAGAQSAEPHQPGPVCYFDIHTKHTPVKPSQSRQWASITNKCPHVPLQSTPPALPCPPAISRQPQICFLSLVINLYFLQFLINGIIQYILTFVWLLPVRIIVIGIWDSFTLLDVSVIHPFLLLNSIPLYGYTNFFLSIHLLMTIRVISSYAINISTQVFIWTYGYRLSLFSGRYLGVKLMGGMVRVCLAF